MPDVRTIGFSKVIKDKLYAGAEFIQTAFSHDEFVNDKKVEIPQGGSLPDVVKNREEYPIEVVTREDALLEYNLDLYDLGALRLEPKDVELSYNKKDSILKQHMKKLRDRIALEALYQWGSDITANQVRTTGAASALALPPGVTANRKGIAEKDLLNVAAKLDMMEMPQSGRYIIMPANMYRDMIGINEKFLDKDYNPDPEANVKMGVVRKIHGLNIILRSYTVVYDNSSVNRKAVGAVTAATDNWGCVAYHEDEICRALGAINVFIDEKPAVYQADVMSANIRFGCRKTRTNDVGVVTLIQGQ